MNLGSYDDPEQTDMIRAGLGIRDYQLKACFTDGERKETEEKEQSLQELFINAGLIKAAKQEKLLHQSTLTGPTAFTRSDARAQILLNRWILNPELIFSSTDPIVNPFNA